MERLKGRALEPQVVVALAEQHASLISILGDVRSAGRYPASPSGEHILDAIARAGGPSREGFDTWVLFERNGRRASVPFGTLLYEDTYVVPNDVIYLYSEPQTFVALGAVGGGTTGGQGQYKFDAWRISLAEAVAKQGGLLDAQADPAAVFLYRGEPKEVAGSSALKLINFRGQSFL